MVAAMTIWVCKSQALQMKLKSAKWQFTAIAYNLKCVLKCLAIRYTESCRSVGDLGTSRWRNNKGT